MSVAIEPPDVGVLFVVSGPSGVGKSTLLRRAMASIPDLGFSVSATTRSPRAGEVDGRDYHFLDATRFSELVASGAFLEHARVYDRAYGTLRAPVEQALAGGRSVILDIDVQGARQVRETFPDAVHVFILPPSRETLLERLRGRGTDDAATIARRMELADGQLAHARHYDYVAVNDDLEAATAVLQAIFVAALHSVECRRSALDKLVAHAT